VPLPTSTGDPSQGSGVLGSKGWCHLRFADWRQCQGCSVLVVRAAPPPPPPRATSPVTPRAMAFRAFESCVDTAALAASAKLNLGAPSGGDNPLNGPGPCPPPTLAFLSELLRAAHNSPGHGPPTPASLCAGQCDPVLSPLPSGPGGLHDDFALGTAGFEAELFVRNPAQGPCVHTFLC